MSPFAKRAPRFPAKGGRSPKPRGNAVKDDRKRRGTRSAQAIARKIGEEAAKGRVAPILDGIMGDVPPLQAKGIAPKALNLRGTDVPQRKGVGRERQLIADAIAVKAEPGNTRPQSGCANGRMHSFLNQLVSGAGLATRLDVTMMVR
jgi:hypothetical protein